MEGRKEKEKQYGKMRKGLELEERHGKLKV